MPRILIIDNDAFVRRSIELVLAKAGYECLIASNALDGIALAERERFDAALIDVHMPGVDGFEALKAIAEMAPGLPVIMMSGSEDDRDSVPIVARQLGSHGFLAKPFSRQQVLETLHRALGAG